MLSQYRLAIYCVGALFLVALLWKLHDAIGDSRETQVRAEIQTERLAEKARTDKLNEVMDHEWQTKVADLQSRVTALLIKPGPAIRLCKPAPQVRLPVAPSVPNEAPVEPGPAVQAGDNIRGPLILYGSECEATRAQLAALESWVNGVTNK